MKALEPKIQELQGRISGWRMVGNVGMMKPGLVQYRVVGTQNNICENAVHFLKEKSISRSMSAESSLINATCFNESDVDHGHAASYSHTNTSA